MSFTKKKFVENVRHFFFSPFPQSQSHVLKVAASLIWKEISYEAVNTSQSLLTGTLTCVLARPHRFFFLDFGP